jgi:Family of unknown function (DUF6361)
VASRVAWLDASADEQRRVREVVQLFSQRETLDEMGGRRIVIALSDELFPGTSQLHSRARYVLFVPWLCQVAATKKDPPGWLDWLERELISSFLDARPELDVNGLVGLDAGPMVKQLPSPHADLKWHRTALVVGGGPQSSVHPRVTTRWTHRSSLLQGGHACEPRRCG